VRTLGAWMQVADERFSGDEIHRCTRAATIPLGRPRPLVHRLGQNPEEE
jgi:hypothetical protein